MEENKEASPLKVSYRTTLEIINKETGREELKIFKDGALIDHKIINEGNIKEK